MEPQVSSTKKPDEILKEIRIKIINRLNQEKRNEQINPLICYALDETLLPQDIWLKIKNAEEGYSLLSIIDSQGYSELSLVIWVRNFYENGDGRDVWKSLSEHLNVPSSEHNKVKKYFTEYLINRACPWSNDLSERKQWKRWMRTQCWVLSISSAGRTSSLINNNVRLSGYLDEISKGVQLTDYVKSEWQNQAIPPYIKVIAQKYPQQVSLTLKSLCGTLSEEELEKNPWLQRIKNDSLLDRDSFKADWYLKDNEIWLIFNKSGRNKKRIFFNNNTLFLRNGGIPLCSFIEELSTNEDDDDNNEVLSSQNTTFWKDSIKHGVMISYGSRLPSLDLDKPQLFIGNKSKLVSTTNPNTPIDCSQKLISVYLPDHYNSKYALSFDPKSNSEYFPLESISDPESLFKIYQTKLPSTQLRPLYLIDLGDDEKQLCFTKEFGSRPKIKLNPEGNPRLKRAQNGDTVFIVGETALFELENHPATNIIVWELTTPDGVSTKYHQNLHTSPGEFRFNIYSDCGQYELLCSDGNGKILDAIHIIYVTSEKDLSRVTDLTEDEADKITPGYGVFQFVGSSKRAVLPLRKGEGTWMWKNPVNPNPSHALTPDEWLLRESRWNLNLDLKYIDDDGNLTYDWQGLKLNGTPITLILDDDGLDILGETSNFLRALFYNEDVAPYIYQFFPYKSQISVTYDQSNRGTVEIFRYVNSPYLNIEAPFLMINRNEQCEPLLWYPGDPDKTLTISVNQEDGTGDNSTSSIKRVQGLAPLYNVGGWRYDRIRTITLEDRVIRTAINRTRRNPGKLRKDIVTVIKTALKIHNYNMFSERGGGSWLWEHVTNPKKKQHQSLEKAFFACISAEKGGDHLSLQRFEDVNETGATLLLGVIATTKQNDESVTLALKSLFKQYPEKLEALESLIRSAFATTESVQWMTEHKYWTPTKAILGFSDYIYDQNSKGTPLEIHNYEEFYQALCDATSFCPESALTGVNNEDAEDILLSYLNICQALGESWAALAKEVVDIKHQLTPVAKFILSVTFSCRLHYRLNRDNKLSKRLLPLDYSIDGSTKNQTYMDMVNCLQSITEHPSLLLAFLFSLSITEQYLNKTTR
jgi:hypothetical protein